MRATAGQRAMIDAPPPTSGPGFSRSGRMVSIDCLGEEVADADTTNATVDAYLKLLDALGRRLCRS
jgi:hypothetical protein